MVLDLTAFSRAIAQLREGLSQARAAPANDLLRDGVIQRFEYSYELGHKMLRRYLAASEADPAAVAALSFPELIRLGWARGLLASGWDRWKIYREARGTTSHTDDAEKARQVFAEVPAFLDEAEALLRELQERVAGA